MNQEQTTDTLFVEEDSDLDQDIAALVNRARDTVEEFVQEQPHMALGLAAAAGFILGGGLTPRRLLRLGFAAGGPTLTKQLTSQVLRFASQALENEQRETAPERSPKGKGRTRTKKESREKENG